MGFYQNMSELAGLPITHFPTRAAADLPADAAADPGGFAWKFRCDRSWQGEGDAWPVLFAAFLERVDTAAVRAIVVGDWGASETDSRFVVQALADAADRLPALRAVFLGEILAEECEVSWIQHGDVSPLLRAYPDLEELWVRGSDPTIEPLEHAGLRKLVMESGGLSGEFVRGLDGCKLPQLRHLELWLGTDEYGGDAGPSDLTEVLAGTNFPKLSYLGLRNALAANEFAEALADAPVVAQLAELDLSLGALTDAGAESLLAGQPLSHLERLDLQHHYMSEAMMARIEEEFLGTGTEVDVSEEQEAEDFDEDGEPTWFSVAVSE